MRLVFGDAKLSYNSSGLPVLNFYGLDRPAVLLPSLTGAAVPDLKAFDGRVLSFSGELEASGSNIEEPRFHWSEFRPTADGTPMSFATACVTGNMGRHDGGSKAVGPSLTGKSLSGSLAYLSIAQKTSWLRLTAFADCGLAPFFSDLDAGTRLLAAGVLESYRSQNNNDRLQLRLRSFQLLGGAGGGGAIPAIASAFSGAETAEAEAPAAPAENGAAATTLAAF
jgi:hypothetical protein